MMNSKPYNLHPYPWKAEFGKIEDAFGKTIGTYKLHQGNETNKSSGRLMAKAPELLDLINITYQTLGELLKTEEKICEKNKQAMVTLRMFLIEALKDG